MVRIRSVFQVKPDRMREAKTLAKELFAEVDRFTARPTTILTDFAADFYSLVFESDYEDVAAFEAAFAEGTSDPAWREAYVKFRDTIVGGRREIYTIVE